MVTPIADTGETRTPYTVVNEIISVLDGFTPAGTFKSPYSYVIVEDGTDTYAANAFQVVYGGPSDAGGVDGADPVAVSQAALDALSGTELERIAFKGEFDIDTILTIPDYCVFDASAAKFTWTGADNVDTSWIIENKDKVGGNEHVYLHGGIWNGGNKAGRIFDFVGLDKFAVRNVCMTNIKQLGAYGCFWGSKNGLVIGNNINAGDKGLGFNFFDGCNNIAVANNVFKDTYDSAISIGSSGVGVLCSEIAVVGNTAIGFAGGNGMGISVFGLASDITIAGNKISNMHFDGINAITDVYTPIRVAAVGNVIKGCGRNGIALESTDSIANSNVIYDITTAGVWIAGDNNIAIGNNIQGCDKGIYVYPAIDNTVLTGNRCRDNDYGIVVSAGCNDTTVIGNNLLGNAISNLTDDGTGTELKSNKGYVNYNVGTSQGTGALQTIAHGLTAMPNSAIIIPYNEGTTISELYADATNIYCTVTNLKDYNWKATCH